MTTTPTAAPAAAPTAPPLRVLVVDDDPVARTYIAALLRRQPDVGEVRECVDGEAAVEAIAASRPDLVFLDVQMPGLDGFEVVGRIGASRMPPVVFTSAYAEFAVRAFEAYALDYVLKPFEDARFLAALERGREQVAVRSGRARGGPGPDAPAGDEPPAEAPRAEGGRAEAGGTVVDERLMALLQHLAHPARPRYPDAVAVKAGGQYVVVRVSDVDWIEADGNYARLHVQKRPRLITKSLATLEREVLDPARFVRVHRSAIVNTAKIVAVEPLFHGDVSLVLDGGTRVDCSRRYRDRLEERLYFTT